MRCGQSLVFGGLGSEGLHLQSLHRGSGDVGSSWETCGKLHITLVVFRQRNLLHIFLCTTFQMQQCSNFRMRASIKHIKHYSSYIYLKEVLVGLALLMMLVQIRTCTSQLGCSTPGNRYTWCTPRGIDVFPTGRYVRRRGQRCGRCWGGMRGTSIALSSKAAWSDPQPRTLCVCVCVCVCVYVCLSVCHTHTHTHTCGERPPLRRPGRRGINSLLLYYSQA